MRNSGSVTIEAAYVWMIPLLINISCFRLPNARAAIRMFVAGGTAASRTNVVFIALSSSAERDLKDINKKRITKIAGYIAIRKSTNQMKSLLKRISESGIVDKIAPRRTSTPYKAISPQ